jgi:polar amino acid transport system ATP-binding protein
VKGQDRKEAKEIGEELLNKVGLSDKRDEYPGRLSGGQQQRVAIARALAMKPKVMLFDEVTSALDPGLVEEVLQVIGKLAREGLTMAIVTHEISFAMDIASDIYFLDGGVIREQGPPKRVLMNPEDAKLRAFLKRFSSISSFRDTRP